MNVNGATLRIGSLFLDTASRKLCSDNQSIRLSNKEFSLLEFFMQNFGRVISRTEILERVWDRNICCSTNTVDVHVSNLRKKIRPYSGRKMIHTVHCVGYVLE